MNRILKYIFSLLFTLPLIGWAQDSLHPISSIGFGMDLARIAVQFVEPERKVYAGFFDVELYKQYDVNVEFGVQTVDIKKDYYHYTSSGFFTKVGIGKDIVKSPDSDISSHGYLILRYAFSRYNEEARHIHLVNNYWGEFIGQMPKQSHTFHWIETGGGLNAELARNFYMGWAIYFRISLSDTDFKQITPYSIPGYGPGINSINIGWSYSISYRFTFKKGRTKNP